MAIEDDKRLASDKEAVFPKLHASLYRVTSEANTDYNCIAYAAGFDHQWWWPVASTDVEWPAGIPLERTIEAFVAAFATLGYATCEDADLELAFEKLALYADRDDLPTHAARQLPSGTWTSKLGEWEDIEHQTLEALEDTASTTTAYGKVVLILRRPASSAL